MLGGKNDKKKKKEKGITRERDKKRSVGGKKDKKKKKEKEKGRRKEVLERSEVH